jgi:serine/threonine protein kinase
MEYASLGTFKTLQASSEPLSFPVKQKLCYDVGRALSALHASGIVHGDMKHENVLIFPSKKPIDGIPYTAKLADFGGTVMDMAAAEVRKMETWTWPFQAPEITDDQALTRSGMMLTDVYSFGLLVWRAFLDGEGFVSLPGAAQTASDEDKRGLTARKASEDLTKTAIVDIYEYAKGRGLSQACVDLMVYTVLHTVQLRPENRDLVKAQAALRGIKYEKLYLRRPLLICYRPGHIHNFLNFIHKKNEERQATEARAAPVR